MDATTVKRLLNTAVVLCMSNMKVGSSEVLFHPDSADFSKVVEATLFVDKSLLIKEMFSENLFRILITAPRRFGKSTNMDMLKRFLEVQVDEQGNPYDRNTTNNYKIFKDNNLQICKYEEFFNEHFGKYPVMHLNFSSFRTISDVSEMLFQLGFIVQRAFLRHIYLLQDSKLWTSEDSKLLFMKFTNGHVILTSHQDVKNAFVTLIELLYKHFKQQVFILIDDYDAHIHSILFKNNPYANRIIIFFDKLIEDLLYCHDEYIRGSMLTGVLRVRERGMRSTGVCHFRYLLDHPFSKFFGITEAELQHVLTKLNLTDEEEQIFKGNIEKYYKGYTINNQNITLFSPWSVLSFLGNRNTVKISVYSQEQSFLIFRPFLKRISIEEEIIKLLNGESVWAKIGDAIFNDDIVGLNKALAQPNTDLNLSVDLFKVLLYHFGFLSVTDDAFGHSIYRVRIPNEDIAMEFRNALNYPLARQHK